jgi:protein phosphatase
VCHAGLSDRGRVRAENQDRWAADPQLGLYVVADGLGGQAAGGVAAQVVVETLPLLVQRRLADITDLSTPEAGERLTAAVAELSAWLRDAGQGRPGLEGLGAAVVVALVRGQWALIAHLGDSRAYLLRQGRLRCLTRDHSLTQLLLDCGEITPADVDRHPAHGRLTRYVGMEGEPLPEARGLPLRRGDQLLLCTDGLAGMVSEAAIRDVLRRESIPAGACAQLIAAANAAGGRDNATAVVLSFPALPSP